MLAWRPGGPLLRQALTVELYEHTLVDLDAAGANNPSSSFTKVENTVYYFTRSSRTPVASNTTTAQRQLLVPLVQKLVQTAQRQLEHMDARELEEAFETLRDEVHRHQQVVLDPVHLTVASLFVKNKADDASGVSVLTKVPHALLSVRDELTSLSMNCSLMRVIPYWFSNLSALTSLTLDGENTFNLPIVTKNKRYPEYMNGVRPRRHTTSKCRGQLTALPNSIGLLSSLRSLFLVNLDGITVLPRDLANLTNLETLIISNCSDSLLLPDLGPMPALRNLSLGGEICMQLPDCVRHWQLRTLQLLHTLEDETGVDYLPAQMWDSLSSTLVHLSLGLCYEEHLKSMPLMPKLEELVVRAVDDMYFRSHTHFHIPASKMPHLKKVIGVCGFSHQVHTLTALESLTIILDRNFGIPVVSAMPSLHDLHATGERLDMKTIPTWFNADIFPNLRNLGLSRMSGLQTLPAAFASFTRLSRLSLVDMKGQITNSAGFKMIVHPSIFQMASLITLNIINCDMTSLPPFSLPSLIFMRISHCTNLRELPALTSAGLPRLSVLQLHSLRCRSLPHSLGELTTLKGLYISKCGLAAIPMSLACLTALEQLIIHQDLLLDVAGPTGPEPCSILTEVAYCLPNMRGLRKLCLRGPDTRTKQMCTDETVAIGLALKAWPLPLVDLLDVNFPILGYATLQSSANIQGAPIREITSVTSSKNMYSEFKHTLPPPPAPFNFNQFVQRLGLPETAVDWDDAQILEFWRVTQSKILAFASGQHPRLGEASAILNTNQNLVVMISEMTTGWYTFVAKDSQRAIARAQEEQLDQETPQTPPLLADPSTGSP